jgi:hypothetical protein
LLNDSRGTSRLSAFDPQFNMDDLFNPGSAGQFLVKWLF